MISEEAKAVVKAADTVTKGLREVLTALNKNTLDCAQSLRKMAESMDHLDDFWHPVFGPNGEIPNENYDWVLVKIRSKEGDKIYPVPLIAHLDRKDHHWSFQFEELSGNNNQFQFFEVRYWRPIPGDNCTTLYANNEPIRRVHTYED